MRLRSGLDEDEELGMLTTGEKSESSLNVTRWGLFEQSSAYYTPTIEGVRY